MIVGDRPVQNFRLAAKAEVHLRRFCAVGGMPDEVGLMGSLELAVSVRLLRKFWTLVGLGRGFTLVEAQSTNLAFHGALGALLLPAAWLGRAKAPLGVRRGFDSLGAGAGFEPATFRL